MSNLDNYLEELYQPDTACYICGFEIDDDREELICDDCETEDDEVDEKN